MRHNRLKFQQAAHWVPHTPAETLVRSLQQTNREDSYPNVLSQCNTHQKNPYNKKNPQ